MIAVPVPAQCPDCGGALQLEEVRAQYQQEIVRQTIWRRFDIPKDVTRYKPPMR